MTRNELERIGLALSLAATVGLTGAAEPAWLPVLHAQAHTGSLATGGGQLLRPGPPLLTTLRGERAPTPTETRLLSGGRVALFPNECAVDFSDSVALAALPTAAADTFAYSPWWFQGCGGVLGNHAVVRPLEYGHFHLIYEDTTITCLDTTTGLFGREQPDHSCSSAGIDPASEPRYVMPHVGDERIHLYVVNQYTNPSDPYSDSVYDKKPFDLKRLRVRPGSTPVRVCYKKVQEIAGPWLTAPDVPVSGGTPGVWMCWAQLGPGLWDLSQWAANVREVKVTATDGITPFAIDDFLIGVQ